MKRTAKPVFFIVALLILALAYTAFFGVYKTYGDRRDTIIRGAKDIRFGIDIRGGVDATFEPKGDVKADDKQMEAVKNVIEKRLVGNKITDYELYVDTSNQRVIVRFPWKNDEEDFDAVEAIEELGKTAVLEFRMGDENQYEEVEVEVKDRDGNVVKDEDGNPVTEMVKKPTGELILKGSQDVDSATAGFVTTESGDEVQVGLKLTPEGTKKFADATKKQVANNGKITIWLDNEVLSSPTVNSHITNGEASITGNFDLESASELANLINSGALPFDIEVTSSGTVTPTMGTKALDLMVVAGCIAFVLVALFMILYYRLPGFVAVIALIGQVAGSIAAVSGYFGFLNSFTLTLPGMAGIILSIGMGVDANVITAERIKEEVRLGKTVDGAINAGSKNSFWAIFDGNITVIIVAIVLMGVFGPPSSIWALVLKPLLFMFPASTTGAVYSFGYTLFVGIIFNFLMGVTASRLMLKSISRFKFLRKPWLLGGDRHEKTV